MNRILPEEALFSFHRGLPPYETLQACFDLKQFVAIGGPWFPTDTLVFCWFYKGLTLYEKNVAWRGTYFFHGGFTPYETLQVCFVLKQFGATRALGFRESFGILLVL